MTEAPLPHPESATLLVVDVQERLMPAMPADVQPSLMKHTTNLVALFSEMGGAILYSEQYPRGLGPTVPELAAALSAAPNVRRVEKTTFSVLRADDAATGEALADLRRDIVLIGMEAHVCVLLTGLDLLARGHRVFVPYDAVASRAVANRDNGLAILTKNGATIVNTETLVFNALGAAGSDAFKRFSARIK